MVAVKFEHSNLAEHQSGIMDQMRALWMENHLCDIVLKCNDGAEHCAHGALLSAASVYFKNLLGGPFLEANQVQRKQPVKIDASKAAVSALLDYIYGGQPEASLETSLELLRMAEAYDLPKFASAIETGLLKSLDGVQALRILQETHGLYSLKAACEEKVAEDFEACSKHPDFGKLGATQLARILKREDLVVSREELVLKGVFNWVQISNNGNFLGTLLQHVDFQSFSIENLLRIGRCTLSGPNAEELQREVAEALKSRLSNVQSSQDFQPKRRCLEHWTPELGASIEASWREVLPLRCNSLSLHEGHIYATDFGGNVLCWNPGDPASARVVVGPAVGTTGVTDLGSPCDLAVSPTGQIFVRDYENDRLVRFEDGCGHLVCDGVGGSDGLFCSPQGVIYVPLDGTEHGKVQKLVGSTLETFIDSENLPQDMQFSAKAIFVTKDEVIYMTDALDRILRIDPAESLEPVVMGQIPNPDNQTLLLWGLFVTEGETGETIYVAEYESRKVFALRPGDGTPSELFRLPDALHPTDLLAQGRSLYVSTEDDVDEPTAGGVYELLLPPELQLDWQGSPIPETFWWTKGRLWTQSNKSLGWMIRFLKPSTAVQCMSIIDLQKPFCDLAKRTDCNLQDLYQNHEAEQVAMHFSPFLVNNSQGLVFGLKMANKLPCWHQFPQLQKLKHVVFS